MLISCPECNAQISDAAPACPHCGRPLQSTPVPAHESSDPPAPQLVKSAKSRGVYVILGLFLGFFGVHNFYAGRMLWGTLQLLTLLLLGWFIFPLFALAIWVIVDLFAVNTDGAGDALL